MMGHCNLFGDANLTAFYNKGDGLVHSSLRGRHPRATVRTSTTKASALQDSPLDVSGCSSDDSSPFIGASKEEP
eukprot:803393-Amphidinium_carterae.2